MGNARSVVHENTGPAQGHRQVLRDRMPELDTIRGLAILGVLVYHLFYWTRDLTPYSAWQRYFFTLMGPGQFGVNLFFVLSGFLITGILLDSRARADYYPRFYYRRALRILPAYYFTLGLVAIFGLASRGYLLLSALYCPNLSGLFGVTLSYTVLWSLGVEEHFYLLWPLAVRKLSGRYLFWISLAILALCPVSRFLYHLQAERSPHPAAYIYYTWNNADGLALGALVAQLLRRPGWGRGQVRRLAAGFFVLALALAAAGYPSILTRRTAFGEGLQMVPWNFGFAGILCIFLLVGSSPWRRFVTLSPLTFLGNISYGLYLYHLLFFSAYVWAYRRLALASLNPSPWAEAWMRAAFVAVTAVCFSYLSRRYFEEPFLRRKGKLPGFLLARSEHGAAWAGPEQMRLPEVSPAPGKFAGKPGPGAGE
jgi:peptidoglycan/LPS O-acetylase OafA/YrhL